MADDIAIRIRVEGERELEKALQIAGLSFRQFNKHLDKNFLSLQKSGVVTDRLTGQITTQGQAVKNASMQARRFKFEWLGIMFAGMALSRVFGGLIKQQMQLFGISEGMAAMWTLVFLPIMELLSPVLWMIIDAMMNLSPEMQLIIGAGIFLAAAFGLILMVIGQVALGVNALLGLLGVAGLSGLLKAIGAFLAGLSAPFLIFLAIALAVILGIYLAWKTNFMNIRKSIAAFIAAFKQFFGGLISIIKGILNIIKGIFTGDFKTVKKGIIQVFKGLWNLILGGFKMLGHGIIIIFKGVAKLVWNIFKVIIDAILWSADKISRFFGGKGVSFRMPSFQTGGLVTRTGPAFLHKGERVVPKGRDTGASVVFSPTVNLNATINNEMDVRVLADKLNKYWAADFERVVQSRGMT